MSVSTVNVFNEYLATGASNTFAITFYVRSTTWLVVKVSGTPTGAWNAVLNPDQSSLPGGTVTLTGGLIPASTVVRIERVTPVTQPDVYNPFSPFPAQTVEFDFDKAICIMQELAYQLSLLNIPPLQANKFLTNDGTNLFWADVIPKPYVVGGFVTSADGVTLTWGTGGGGGGGGVNLIGVPTTPTPNAAIISGIGANVLQLAVADQTNPGLVSTVAQMFGGTKIFKDGIAGPYDVRRYGAVPNDSTQSIAPAWYAAQAGAVSRFGLFPAVSATATFPFIDLGNETAVWYTDMPLCLTNAVTVDGRSPLLNCITIATGGTASPGIKSFAGPVVYVAGPYTTDPINPSNPNFPVFTTSLLTGSGSAIILDPAQLNQAQQIPLHDAWGWCTWLQARRVTDWALQFQYKFTGTPTNNFRGGVIGSRGPDVWGPHGSDGSGDVAFGVYVTCNSTGTQTFFNAYLTTAPSWTSLSRSPVRGDLHTIVSTAITPGTSYNLELDYNGAFFDFYVNGVNQGHVAVSGPILKTPWEGVHIGGQGPEGLDPASTIFPAKGVIDSIRLSSTARHTGTGSFTPPTAKYAWDANTVALYNWDQPTKTIQPTIDGSPVGPLLYLPFLVGQTLCATALGSFGEPTLSGPLPHYMRMFAGTTAGDCNLNGFSVVGLQGVSGIVSANAYQCLYSNLIITGCTQWGLRIGTAVSFFNRVENVISAWAWGAAFQVFGDVQSIVASGSPIGVWLSGGCDLKNYNNQPAYSAFASVVVDGGGSGPSGLVSISNSGHDLESFTYTRVLGLVVVFNQTGTVLSKSNGYVCAGSTCAPLVFFSLPKFVSENDSFHPNTSGVGGSGPGIVQLAQWPVGSPPGKILCISPAIFDFNVPQLPLSNLPGWITIIDEEGITNLGGISTTYTAATQFAGSFTIQDAFTDGGPRFLVPMPDTNYSVKVSPAGFHGSAPAAGSNRPTFDLIKTQLGFTQGVETAPGAGSTVVYDYTITGVDPPPLFFSFAPSVPSGPITSPLAGSTGPIAIGVTVSPNARNVFALNISQAAQTFVSSGNTPVSGNWWELELVGQGYNWNRSFGNNSIDMGAVVASNGELCSILSPGAHNIVSFWSGGGASTYFDGNSLPGGPSVATLTQPATFFIGKRFDASQPLSTAVLANLKIDTLPNRVLSNDNTIGPGDQDQAAFFGDDWTMGYASTSVNGGACTQIAEANYGTTFFHMAARSHGQVTAPVNFSTSLVSGIWVPWQGNGGGPTLVALTIMAGWYDLLEGASGAGASGAAIWAQLLSVLEGAAATVFWNPPTSQTTPFDQRARCILQSPQNGAGGTAHFTVNGTGPIASTWATSNFATATALGAALVANGTINSQFNITVIEGHPGFNDWCVNMQWKVGGTVGNAIVCSTDGGGGSYIFGDQGGVIGIGPSANLFGGLDNTFSIGGVRFIQNFDTNVATTLAAAMAQVNGDPTTSALVTASIVGSQMKVVADAVGSGGNDIALAAVAINTAVAAFQDANGNTVGTRMVGGIDGAATSLAIPNVLLCNIPPMKGATGYTAGKETQRGILNGLINAYVHAGVTVVDLATALKDGGDPTLLNPAYGTVFLNNAGQTALFGILNPLLP